MRWGEVEYTLLVLNLRMLLWTPGTGAPGQIQQCPLTNNTLTAENTRIKLSPSHLPAHQPDIRAVVPGIRDGTDSPGPGAGRPRPVPSHQGKDPGIQMGSILHVCKPTPTHIL